MTTAAAAATTAHAFRDLGFSSSVSSVCKTSCPCTARGGVAAAACVSREKRNTATPKEFGQLDTGADVMQL